MATDAKKVADSLLDAVRQMKEARAKYGILEQCTVCGGKLALPSEQLSGNCLFHETPEDKRFIHTIYQQALAAGRQA